MDDFYDDNDTMQTCENCAYLSSIANGTPYCTYWHDVAAYDDTCGSWE